MSKIQFESNSQPQKLADAERDGCDQYVKDTIWKQFTTMPDGYAGRLLLWPICQRYNLKAIHNTCTRLAVFRDVVTNMSKIQFESNSQPARCACKRIGSCDQYVKDTIWKQFTTTTSCSSNTMRLWPICQRYNLKAIHNLYRCTYGCHLVVTNMSKIQFEPGILCEFD